MLKYYYLSVSVRSETTSFKVWRKQWAHRQGMNYSTTEHLTSSKFHGESKSHSERPRNQFLNRICVFTINISQMAKVQMISFVWSNFYLSYVKNFCQYQIQESISEPPIVWIVFCIRFWRKDMWHFFSSADMSSHSFLHHFLKFLEKRCETFPKFRTFSLDFLC